MYTQKSEVHAATEFSVRRETDSDVAGLEKTPMLCMVVIKSLGSYSSLRLRKFGLACLCFGLRVVGVHSVLGD